MSQAQQDTMVVSDYDALSRPNVEEKVTIRITDRDGAFVGNRHVPQGSTAEVFPRVALLFIKRGRAVYTTGSTPSSDDIVMRESRMSSMEFREWKRREAERLKAVEEGRRVYAAIHVRVVDPGGIAVVRDGKVYGPGQTFLATSSEADAYFAQRRAEFANPSQVTPSPEELSDRNAIRDHPYSPQAIVAVAVRKAVAAVAEIRPKK